MLCKELYGRPGCQECDNMDPEAACPDADAFYGHLAACPRCKDATHWTKFCVDRRESSAFVCGLGRGCRKGRGMRFSALLFYFSLLVHLALISVYPVTGVQVAGFVGGGGVLFLLLRMLYHLDKTEGHDALYIGTYLRERRN